ncbi:MAG: TraB/GumN family protein [Sphingobacteriaceae bacterium]
MKQKLKCISLCLIIVFIGLNTSAQTSVKPGLLWEVSGKGLKAPSYLFGTYHLIGKNFLDTLPEVVKQLAKAETVVGEVIIEDEAAMAQKLMPMMMLQGNSLDKILTTKEYAETDSFVKAKTGMTLTMLNGLKPSAVQIMLIAYIAPKNVTPQNPPIDKYFQTEAIKANKQVIGLETLAEQGTILFDSPLERQKALLLKTVRESDRMIEESNELFEQYKRQDLEAIEKAFFQNEDYTPEEMNTLLAKRNKTWMTKIPALMSDGPVFFAIGAGHLVGDEGLIALLKEEGYTLRALQLK